MPSDRGQELWNESADAWIEGQGETGDQSRQFLDPFVYDVLGDVTGLQIADIGCGEGRFSRILNRMGAVTTGVEPTSKLYQTAVERDPEGSYLKESALKLSIPDSSMDIALFYLSMIDFDPIEPAVGEAFRILKSGGTCVVVNLTSMNTASNSLWILDEAGNRVGWAVEDYGRSHPNEVAWKGIRIINYHRPLSEYFQTFLNQGFQLRSFQEPIPTKEQIANNPILAGHLVMPYFNIHTWQKPANV